MKKWLWLIGAFLIGGFTSGWWEDMVWGFTWTPKQKQDMKTYRDACKQGQKTVLAGKDGNIVIEQGDSTYSDGMGT